MILDTSVKNYTTRIYDNLNITQVEESRRDLHQGYRYLITDRWISFTAFVSPKALDRWINERGLTLPDMPEDGRHFSGHIEGAFKRRSYMSMEDFSHLDGDMSVVMSNGSITLSIITEETWIKDEVAKVINHLNPNVKTRTIFHHRSFNHLLR